MNNVKIKKVKVKSNKIKYDDKFSQELAEKIQEITHSGNEKLNESDCSKIRSICKRSDKYVRGSFSILSEYLEKNHAEIRLSAFQICNLIFRESHCFRELMVLNLENVVKLTTSENLPPPQKAARKLRNFALKCIHEWNTAFGDAYKKLAIGYRYLQQVEKIDFNAYLENSTDQTQQRRLNERVKAVNEVRKNKILADIKEKQDEIKETVTSLSNSINLLLPHPDEFFISVDEGEEDTKVSDQLGNDSHDAEDDSEVETGDSGLREVGMVNIHHSLQLEFTPCSEATIQETPDNYFIIENVREYAKVIQNKYLSIVKVWLEVLSKTDGSADEITNVRELKGDIDDVLFKYGRLAFISADKVSSDSELEEVPDLTETKNNTTPFTKHGLVEWNIVSNENTNKSPALLANKKEKTEEAQPSTSSGVGNDRKQRLMSVAPKLPFDIDLYHWEDDKLPVPTLVPSSTDGHRFWVGAEGSIDELPVPEGSATLRTRVIEFTGSFKPVAHSCRVRLPSGKLCPRRDRVKCPFHGIIVPRDELGDCINPKDAIRVQELREKQQREKPDWQNPKLLADIKKATGIDLKMPEKGKRKKRKNQSGLTDLKEGENSSKMRLEKKIFKRSVMKKVASAMDKMDHRKFKDKFGDQFNYFYDT